MIELTDEQNYAFRNRNWLLGNDVSDESSIVFANDFLKSLTLPQIKQLAEQHNASVVEWVDFDADDESTWPKSNYCRSLVEYSNGSVELSHNQDLLFDFYIRCFNQNNVRIKRTSEIPQRKAE